MRLGWTQKITRHHMSSESSFTILDLSMLNIFSLKTKLNWSSFKIQIFNKSGAETGPEALFQEAAFTSCFSIYLFKSYILSLGLSSIVQSINSQEVWQSACHRLIESTDLWKLKLNLDANRTKAGTNPRVLGVYYFICTEMWREME